MAKFPVPPDADCTASGSGTVTLTLPNCAGYFQLLLGQLYVLADVQNYDNEPGAQLVADAFQDAIDLAIYGQQP